MCWNQKEEMYGKVHISIQLLWNLYRIFFRSCVRITCCFVQQKGGFQGSQPKILWLFRQCQKYFRQCTWVADLHQFCFFLRPVCFFFLFSIVFCLLGIVWTSGSLSLSLNFSSSSGTWKHRRFLQAEQLRRSTAVKTKDFIIVIDGLFGPHTKKAGNSIESSRFCHNVLWGVCEVLSQDMDILLFSKQHRRERAPVLAPKLLRLLVCPNLAGWFQTHHIRDILVLIHPYPNSCGLLAASSNAPILDPNGIDLALRLSWNFCLTKRTCQRRLRCVTVNGARHPTWEGRWPLT